VLSCNHCCCRKAMSVTQPGRVYLQTYISSMQCACAILSYVALHAVQCFSTLSRERHDFRKKKVTEYKMHVLIFSTILFETCLIVRRIERHMIKMYIDLHVKYPLFLFDFQRNLNFSTDFRKILKYQFSLKTVQWKPSCSMWTDRRT